MKNLGKIVLLLILMQFYAYASVKATVDAKSVEIGEMVTYSLDIVGTDITRPNIRTLCGVDVISTSSRTSIEMIGSDIKRKNILGYKFIPQNDCVIEPMEIEIDDKIEKTNSIKIKVGAVVVRKDDNFILILQTDKKEVLVGESFDVTLLFKHKKGAEAVDNKFTPPKLKGFWVKNESQPQRWDDANYSVTKIIYTMAAQRVGQLKISKAQMRIASRRKTRDSWGSWMQQVKWKSYFSNDISIDVKPLPNGVDLVGNFTIYATVDKDSINSNEAVNLTIKVLGDGNLEDIKSFKPYIDGVNIFDEKIVINRGTLIQKIAFVGDRDFVIKPFELKFFNPDTKEIKTISTDEIKIKIKDAKPKKELLIKRDKKTEVAEVTKINVVQNSVSYLWLLVAFLVGVAVGIVLMITKGYNFKKSKKSISLKDPKVLLIKLFPYKDDEEVQKIIDILEKNIYGGSTLSIDKKVLKEILKKYGIN